MQKPTSIRFREVDIDRLDRLQAVLSFSNRTDLVRASIACLDILARTMPVDELRKHIEAETT